MILPTHYRALWVMVRVRVSHSLVKFDEIHSTQLANDCSPMAVALWAAAGPGCTGSAVKHTLTFNVTVYIKLTSRC